MLIGTTFSHRQAAYLELNALDALNKTIDMGFDYIRLGSYWLEIEVEPGKYDLANLKQQLTLCEQKNQKVVLTVGAKAPRWPEFYIPSFYGSLESYNTQQAVLEFVEFVVVELKEFSCITHWQVENEPLDPVWPEQLIVSDQLLYKEVALVRSLDDRPVVLNAWGNDLSSRGVVQGLADQADIIGVDLYYKQYFLSSFGSPYYRGPSDSDFALKNMFSKLEKPVWVIELQAEPWEKDEAAFKSEQPRSISVKKMEKNFARATALNVEAIFLWGCEYWLWRAQNLNDTSYLELVQSLIDHAHHTA